MEKIQTKLCSTDPSLLDMLNVQNLAIFTDERPKVPLLRVLTKALIQQDTSGTRGRYSPISCNGKAQRPSGKRKYAVFTLSKMQNEYLRKLRPTPLTSSKSKDFLSNPELLQNAIFDTSISSIQIQLLVCHTKTHLQQI